MATADHSGHMVKERKATSHSILVFIFNIKGQLVTFSGELSQRFKEVDIEAFTVRDN